MLSLSKARKSAPVARPLVRDAYLINRMVSESEEGTNVFKADDFAEHDSYLVDLVIDLQNLKDKNPAAGTKAAPARTH